MTDTSTVTAATTKALNHFAAVGIGVSDMARSVEFYTKVMGMKQMQTFELPHMKEVVLGYKGDVAVVLMHYIDGSAQHYTNNPVKLVFNIDDPKALAARIRAAGLEVTREPEPLPEFGNMIVGLAKDPDGYVIEMLKQPG
jgi:lactoylglutathione lyase